MERGDHLQPSFAARDPAVPRTSRPRLFVPCVALVASAVAFVASRADAETKLELGVRTGYALPFGDIYDPSAGELASRDVTIGQVPLWFDIGARMGVDAGVSDNAAVGGAAFTVGKYLSPRLYLSYGVGLFTPGEVVSLKYIFNKRWNFEAQNATSGNRAGINYRWEK